MTREEVATFILGGTANSLHNIRMEIADINDSISMLENIGALSLEEWEHISTTTKSIYDQVRNLKSQVRNLKSYVEPLEEVED